MNLISIATILSLCTHQIEVKLLNFYIEFTKDIVIFKNTFIFKDFYQNMTGFYFYKVK